MKVVLDENAPTSVELAVRSTIECIADRLGGHVEGLERGLSTGEHRVAMEGKLIALRSVCTEVIKVIDGVLSL